MGPPAISRRRACVATGRSVPYGAADADPPALLVPMTPRAVIFDLGGVVVGSPLHAIAAYERELGLPANAVNRVVVAAGPRGAWSRLERGELGLEEFYP